MSALRGSGETFMAIKLDGSMGQLVDAIADRFADRVLSRLGGTRNGLTGGGNGRRSSALRGRKLDMHCRFPGCKNPSKGPRFRFLCEEHLKLPKAKVQAAIEKSRSKPAG